MSISRKDIHVADILNIEVYRDEISRFNAVFSDLKTFFRDVMPTRDGTFSLLEIARDYLNMMSSMAWRLSVLTFEVSKEQAPELYMFKSNVVAILTNLNTVELKLRELNRCDKIWQREYKQTLRYNTKGKPYPTDYERYWTDSLKMALDKCYHDINNTIHTAIALGDVLKIKMAIIDELKSKPLYAPKFTSLSEASEDRKKRIQKSIGRKGEITT